MLLIETIRKLAEENPEAVYSVSDIDFDNCQYTRGVCGPGSGCIVGQAIAQLYPDKIPKMVAQDNRGPIGAAALFDDLDIEYKRKEIRWINTVQARQDVGHPWLDAIKLADNCHQVLELS